MDRASPSFALLTALLLGFGCAHARHPGHDAAIARGDCAELLKAADAARAAADVALARDLASACSQEKLDALVKAAPPEEGLLWCGRAKAATADKPACSPSQIGELTASLHARITFGPADSDTPLDPLLAAALDQAGKELNLAWDAADPDVIVGRLSVTVDHLTSRATATVADVTGTKLRIPATQHRFVARAEAQVELGTQTRTLRAVEEARDLTWEASARPAVAAHFDPQVPPEAELKKRAVVSWLRAFGKALSAAPPEAVDVSDAKGCVAYGLSLNLAAGDSTAAARGLGDPQKILACEHLLGEPVSAGIPVP